MKFSIPYENASSSDTAYKTVRDRALEESLKKFKVKVELECDDASKQICAKGKGFKLNLDFSDEEAMAKLDLSMLLKPMKKKIVSSIKHELSKVI